jgi:hypothetical protein
MKKRRTSIRRKSLIRAVRTKPLSLSPDQNTAHQPPTPPWIVMPNESGQTLQKRTFFDEQLTKNVSEQTTKLLNIFRPYAARSLKRIVREKRRFVHYTSATNALSIIQSKRLWMRNTTCMSDYAEVWHGLQAMRRCFWEKPSRWQAFEAALNRCHQDAANHIRVLFELFGSNTHLQTYVTSLSEHDDQEDLHGRLSMWRAFGGEATARVALVIKLDPDPIKNSLLHIMLSPVAYFTDQELEKELDALVRNVRAATSFLRREIEPGVFALIVWGMLTSLIVCLKHEGFREEREWRLVHSPQPFGSFPLESAVEGVFGIPQRTYKIPLENKSNAGIKFGLPDLLDRLIIGPTQFPWVMRDAFVAALDAAGVKDAANRVFVSQIPVRN